MKLSAPKQITFIIALVLLILALIGFFVPAIPVIGGFAFWFAVVSSVLLLLGCYLKGF